MKSYLKFLSRNKLYTAIEAVGLAVSLAFVIIIGSYVWQQYAVTWEHPDRDRVYVPGTPGFPALTYGFPDAIGDIPEIESVSRMCNVAVHPAIRGEQTEAESVGVEPAFFEICPQFRFVEGSADVLSVPSNVILSVSFAQKYSLAIGDALDISGNSYVVGAILEDLKGTVIKPYDIFLNAAVYKDEWQPFDNYGSTVTLTKVRPETDRKELYDKLESVCKDVYSSIYGQSFFEHLELSRYDELFFKETEGFFRHGDKATLRVLMLVGLLLLLSAILNYINLSVALTGKRAKEMAVRQLSGASRVGIIWKYVAESIAFTAVCFAAGLLLAEAFCPAMNALLNNPDIPIKVIWSPGYIVAYIVIILLVGALCGISPAMMAGRYKPVDVMKGGYRRRSKMIFSKVFIVLQNALAVILIALAITMEAQMRKTQERPMNCNIENIFFLKDFSSEDNAPLKDALEALPCVRRIGRSSGVPGSINMGQYSTTRDGQDILYKLIRLDSTAFSMFGFEILEDFHAPQFNSVWFSDKSFAATGFDADYHDISGTLSRRTKGCEQVAGVFKSFPTNNANIGEEDYAIVSLMRSEDIPFAGWVIETTPDRKAAKAQIMEAYDNCIKGKQIYGNLAFWVDENIAEAWKPARNNMRLVEIFMLLSIIIALLGLVAMSTYYADEKSRDIAVRKVFGGTVDTEAWRTIRDYMVLVSIACVIGIPIAVYAAQEYLKDFIYRLEGYWWIFVVAVLLTGLIAFVSVIWQVLKAAKTNPAIELKKE
ncbi:MAG: FtsX-like permease family protein [Bacteroidales bacterium]|jgi:putative ABC transport system permease protein|nr:FtsX-like permease family protein [Bacteroidales bacterium]